ncbi:MAG: VCBS repeat-containing protein [Ferruginibacter sp.]|nr:VCBS repeat-containing protein [Cytophagales bacterium]
MNSLSRVVLWSASLAFGSCQERTLFEQVSSSHSNVHFNNLITESDSLNPLTEVNIYNGGGVGTGDFNGDGLPDIYLAGNMVANRLYLNRGGLRFADVTQTARVGGAGRWCRGVSVVDINNDGKPDIYLAVSLAKDPRQRENLLYVNQGKNREGIPVFKELAAEYGLNDRTHTTMAHFFDYDNDGDLDAYLVVNEHLPTQNPSKFIPIVADGSHPSTGRLYRNDWNVRLHHGVFTNVSGPAGIQTEGYGHAAIISDINQDGWKDIYVTNDFVSNNILYVNNQDGTFTDRAKEYFKQTSTFAMGVDMQDLNNDGLLDVVELDMNPPDNYRKKMMLGANSYQTVQNFERYGYQYQYSRNTLQLNQGPRVGPHDSVGAPLFSQIGFLSGIAETDWSWTPLVADFDNDGYRDLVVTNGYPKDVTDHDFMIFRTQVATVASPEDILRQIPQVKLNKYAFRNNGNVTFDNVTRAWGLTIPTFSSGATTADLDNDGDLDMVINNTNDEALIYRNRAVEENPSTHHFLNLTFSGDTRNRNGLGAWAEIFYAGGKRQIYENTPYRGYLSSAPPGAHFGLGSVATVDSVVIRWPNFKKQVLKNVKADQVVDVKMAGARVPYSFSKPALATTALFREITDSVDIHYRHQESDFVDFNVQKLLPHKLSEYAPALAAGDVDGNGRDDVVCGGSSSPGTTLFLQQNNGRFIQRSLLPPPMPHRENRLVGALVAGGAGNYQDAGLLLFDADGDGDLDLYVARGGYAQAPHSAAYQDQLYANDGQGNYTLDREALPRNFTSKLCVRAADYDRDGDLDLFVAGRVEPWHYPRPVSSFIFRNDSQGGHIAFTDVTNAVAKALTDIGLVCDAVFTDFDGDGWQDLVIAGEWMPPTFLKNERGRFKNVGADSGVDDQVGWWNSIAPGDFDNDGDPDYVVGNLGLNSYYQASDQYPVCITAKDFDDNGSYDAFPSLFLPASNEHPEKKEFPAHGRDDVVKQMVGMRAKFQNYHAFAQATMDQLFTPEQRKGALRLKANQLASVYLRNNGHGNFTATPLPVPAQVSVLYGMAVNDFDGDGNLDVVISGNDYGTEVSVGRYDALNGLLMKGDGKGAFIPQSMLQSGICIPGNGKALVQLRNNGKNVLAASQNNGPLVVFELKSSLPGIPVGEMDVSATLAYKNGNVRKMEFQHGASFLSQSARFLPVPDRVASIQITDSKGVVRTVTLNEARNKPVVTRQN